MADETYNIKISDDEAVLEKQFRRAVSSFEGIVLSQIDIKNKLADRLNYSIRAGIIILGVIAISILILLLTLDSGQLEQTLSALDALSFSPDPLERDEIDAEAEAARQDAIANAAEIYCDDSGSTPMRPWSASPETRDSCPHSRWTRSTSPATSSTRRPSPV